jgi:hypothetical protein
MTTGAVVVILVPFAIFFAFAGLVWYDESVRRAPAVTQRPRRVERRR